MFYCAVMAIKPAFMKSLKPNFIKLLHGTLICSLLVTGACKKDKKETEPVKLLGGWVDTSKGPAAYTQLTFNAKGEFSSTLLFHDNGKTSGTTYSGTYTIKGDSLKIAIKEKTEADQNSKIVVTPSSFNIFEKATFVLKDNVLTIKYITYPADAPVVGEAKFSRAAID